jgi:hypothetical protein
LHESSYLPVPGRFPPVPGGGKSPTTVAQSRYTVNRKLGGFPDRSQQCDGT